MDYRPPRATPPHRASLQPIPSYRGHPDDFPGSPASPPPNLQDARGVSFQNVEQGDRSAPLDHASRRRAATRSQDYDVEDGSDSKIFRKKSLVRPDREKIDPGHRQWYYRNHAMQMETEGIGKVNLVPSTTGNVPQLRRGRSLLGREEDVQESGLSIFKRSATLRRKRQSGSASGASGPAVPEKPKQSRLCYNGPGPGGPWMTYCYILTILVPNFALSAFGLRTPERQRAWREKMGLLSLVLSLMAGVGFLTFGFTETVCGKPPLRFASGTIQNASVIIHGQDYDFSDFKHPAVGQFNGSVNPLYVGNWHLDGADASFMFQNVNQNCKGIITKASNSSISGSNGDLDWYFPCNVYNQFGTSDVNTTSYQYNTTCHNTNQARDEFAQQFNPKGQVFYTWDQVQDPSRNLVVYESSVLDLNLLQWLSRAEVDYPKLFDEISKPNGTFNGRDMSMYFFRTDQRKLAECLQDVVTVGFIEDQSIGCTASDVVLYVSLVFIIGVVSIRFVMAVLFSWFYSWKIGSFQNESYATRMRRAEEIENWSEDIYRPAPSQYRPNVTKNGLAGKHDKRKTLFPRHSRFTPLDSVPKGPGARPTTMYGTGAVDTAYKRATMYGDRSTMYGPPSSKGGRLASSSVTSLSDSASRTFNDQPCPFPLKNVIPQPPSDYEPFNYPLAHTICLVTAYSESVEGLRTTLDSLATTDYPNSHKLIMVIADGMVQGAGNTMTTPEIVLSMMKEFIVPPEEVEGHSYVAIADGHKRHNMAKVYAGFYMYDDNTIEMSKQQRVPIILVAKVGNPMEANDRKPGNRGKRDSQIVLMSFLQKVMFDERMTTMEYEFFNAIWRVTGVSPDRYEIVLMVDADTKVFPDSASRMVACLVHDPEIMGLCGETKIANKSETWVTMIQVFEYYISHHLTKAFESMFGGVTCLPGCFSMYRIKSPKGESGYWVPILANPDIIEHYSENVVDTLHKKNLLLLGEDRYLSSLMLRTFPKRKMIFCPQAVCKTIVPDTFRVLLSQRRRWINSTVHNLCELLLVRDLCGTFCFSMQFVVFMELAGTLVLPAAISFTLYLVVIAIIPGTVKPIIPLILLGIILGLPGLLIVVTSRKIAYVGWMLVYLLSLPIWNFVLPAYAFWHFDDFSWGETRVVQGGDKAAGHGDKEGDFDSSHIVMKRWAEFERERRWRTGTQSRDSTYYDMRSQSPKRPESQRYSTSSGINQYDAGAFDSGSTMESSSHHGGPRPRFDSAPLLHLPAPLSVHGGPGSTSFSDSGVSRTSTEIAHNASVQRLIPSPGHEETYSPVGRSPDPFDEHSPTMVTSPQAITPIERHLSRSNDPNAVFRQNTVSTSYPVETENPYRHSVPQGVTATYDEPDEYSHIPGAVPGFAQRVRGVSLADNGPVPGPEGAVRRVARSANRKSTQQQQQPSPSPNRQQSRPMSPPATAASPSSATPMMFNLPPGAAPPKPQHPRRY